MFASLSIVALAFSTAPVTGSVAGGPPIERPAPLASSLQDDYPTEGAPVSLGSGYSGPTRVIRDPIYGDMLYGGVNAPREAALYEDAVRMRLGLNILSVSESDLKDAPGDVDANRGGVDFGLDIPMASGAGLSLNAAYEASRYNFDGVSGSSLGAQPFRSTHIASLSASLWQRFEGGATLFGTYTFGAGWQEESEPAEGQSYMLSAGGTFEVEPDLHIGFAVLAIDLLEKQLAYLIYPILDWRIAPEWRLATAETGLPGFALFFEPDDRFSIYGAVGAELRQFRTNSEGTLADLAVRDERVRVSGGVRWRVGSNMYLWTEGGMYAYQRLEAFDSEGSTVAKERIDPALFASARLQITF